MGLKNESFEVESESGYVMLFPSYVRRQYNGVYVAYTCAPTPRRAPTSNPRPFLALFRTTHQELRLLHATSCPFPPRLHAPPSGSVPCPRFEPIQQ